MLHHSTVQCDWQVTSRCAASCTTDPNSKTSWTFQASIKTLIILLLTQITHAVRLAVWSLSILSCLPSGNQLVLRSDSRPASRSLWAHKLWLETFSLHSVGRLWLLQLLVWWKTTLNVSTQHNRLLSLRLSSSSSPPSFLSFSFCSSSPAVWRSDSSGPPCCNTAVKPF